MEEPWFELSVERKIGLENELYKEIGLTETSLFDYLKLKHNTHKLADFEFSALATYCRNDDVLFATRKNGIGKNFVVLHLTWKGKKEIDTCPSPDFFTDFDEFKFLRMYPDKVEWEY